MPTGHVKCLLLFHYKLFKHDLNIIGTWHRLSFGFHCYEFRAQGSPSTFPHPKLMKVTLVDLQDTLEKGTLVTRQHGIAKVLPLIYLAGHIYAILCRKK